MLCSFFSLKQYLIIWQTWVVVKSTVLTTQNHSFFVPGKPQSVESSERVQLSGTYNVRKGKLQLPVNRWTRRQVILCGTCLIVSSVKQSQTGKMHILPLIGGKVCLSHTTTGHDWNHISSWFYGDVMWWYDIMSLWSREWPDKVSHYPLQMSPCAVKFVLDDISPSAIVCPLVWHLVMLPALFVSAQDQTEMVQARLLKVKMLWAFCRDFFCCCLFLI